MFIFRLAKQNMLDFQMLIRLSNNQRNHKQKQPTKIPFVNQLRRSFNWQAIGAVKLIQQFKKDSKLYILFRLLFY